MVRNGLDRLGKVKDGDLECQIRCVEDIVGLSTGASILLGKRDPVERLLLKGYT